MELIDTGHRRISRYLDLTRVRVLGLVGARGPLRPRDIAEALDMTASAVSRHLTALQEAGQVEVVEDGADARTFLVRVTDAGRADIEATLATGSSAFQQAVADWSDADVATARELVDRLLAAFDRPRPTPPAARTGRPRWQRRTNPQP
jgi:DNA-binding MarR family transcriptional regulator